MVLTGAQLIMGVLAGNVLHGVLYWVSGVWWHDWTRGGLDAKVVGRVVANQVIGAMVSVLLFDRARLVAPMDLELGGWASAARLGRWYGFQCVYFYVVHRLLHAVPWLYRDIHELHHRHREVQAYVAIDGTPQEHMVLNLFSVLLAPLLTGFHVAELALWVVVVTLSSTRSHRAGQRAGHALHHRDKNCNYGTGWWLDGLMGTWRSS